MRMRVRRSLGCLDAQRDGPSAHHLSVGEWRPVVDQVELLNGHGGADIGVVDGGKSLSWPGPTRRLVQVLRRRLRLWRRRLLGLHGWMLLWMRLAMGRDHLSRVRLRREGLLWMRRSRRVQSPGSVGRMLLPQLVELHLAGLRRWLVGRRRGSHPRASAAARSGRLQLLPGSSRRPRLLLRLTHQMLLAELLPRHLRAVPRPRVEVVGRGMGMVREVVRRQKVRWMIQMGLGMRKAMGGGMWIEMRLAWLWLRLCLLRMRLAWLLLWLRDSVVHVEHHLEFLQTHHLLIPGVIFFGGSLARERRKRRLDRGLLDGGLCQLRHLRERIVARLRGGGGGWLRLRRRLCWVGRRRLAGRGSVRSWHVLSSRRRDGVGRTRSAGWIHRVCPPQRSERSFGARFGDGAWSFHLRGGRAMRPPNLVRAIRRRGRWLQLGLLHRGRLGGLSRGGVGV